MFDALPHSPLVIVAAVVVGVVSTGRLTRLVVQDHYPPVVWLRDWWRRVTKDGPWALLVDCVFCASTYLAIIVLGWGLLSGLHWSWWVVNGWLALAYVAAMLVVRDEPE